MKAVILAGGFGTRLSEETGVKPKPMVEIGGKPILWHLMKIYSHYGINDFVICLGYKGYYIKEYFANYFLHQSDVTIDLKNNQLDIHNNSSEPWRVTLVDTGYDTMTGGRIKRIQDYVDGTFLLNYGDAVADVNIDQLTDFHRSHGKILTMTSVQPEGKYGRLEIKEDNKVTNFLEKPKGEQGWVNGGFFVCESQIFDYIDNDPMTVFEQKPLQNLAQNGEIFSYQHTGFWQCMDTVRDKNKLEELWEKDPHWKLWK